MIRIVLQEQLRHSIGNLSHSCVPEHPEDREYINLPGLERSSEEAPGEV